MPHVCIQMYSDSMVSQIAALLRDQGDVFCDWAYWTSPQG